jgi:UDP-2-acetamido-3-amino-2,3-dideoxy-glucuronate N-acetyltransferase
MDYFVHESSYIDDNVKIGKGTNVWHFCHLESGVSIGDNCILGQNVYIGKNVKIGNGCKLQNNVSIYSGVTLGNNVFCGPSCVFTNVLTPRAKYPMSTDDYIETKVKDGASIGANATIVCGITIGQNAMVGAGAVVTKNVPDNVLVVGVPAQQVKSIDEVFGV